jgi:hypothetical protein
LEECLSCCSSQRRAKINYYLGLGYKQIQQPLKAFSCFEKANQLFKNNAVYGCPRLKKKVILSHIEEFMDASQIKYVIDKKADEMQVKGF